MPDTVGQHLSLLRGGLGGARWIDPDNYHLTLRFIGDIDLPMAREIDSALGRIKRRPIMLEIDGLSSFGGKKPHSVFARIKPSLELLELQSEQERMMQRLGLRPEARKFTPHITIARCKGASPERVANWLALRGGIMGLRFEVGEFVLFSSRDSVGGGPYVVEEAYPLVA